jgi:eukaryotic-like serine/threonine-protein kinase
MNQALPLTVGRYQLTEKIGAGTMGIVYKGLDPLIGRPIAVKLIRTDLIDESDRDAYRARFRQEVRSAGRCVHPGIVTVYDYAERDGDPYIVMEYVDGPILQRLFDKGRLTAEEAVDITLQLLAALAHAHRQGVVHRDIKPANIIMGPAGRVKITDFGIARMESSALTSAGTLLGTPSYMAPEQARGERVDHRADLFAVGVVFLRMLTGALPYGNDSFAAVLRKMAAPEAIDLSALDAIEPRLASVAALALAKNPAERFQSAEEFEHLLRSMTVDYSETDLWPGMTAEIGRAIQDEDPAEAAAHCAWPEDLQLRLRTALAEHVGPIASLLVTRAAAASASLNELVEALCPAIEDSTARARFADTARVIVGPDAAPRPTVSTRSGDAGAAQSPSAEAVPVGIMSAAQHLLARFIGPIAGLIVRQSSLEVRSLDEFGDRLASHLEQGEERAQFKRELATVINRHEKTHDRLV